MTHKLTHSSISLDNTATHTAQETSNGRVDTQADTSGLDLGRSEEEDGTLR